MRCFKIFFKHTWHPEQMEGSGRFGEPVTSPCEVRATAADTELGELKPSCGPEVPGDGPSAAAAAAAAAGRGVPCYNGACRSSAAGGKSRPERRRLDSPWHFLKTFFLVAMIVALLVWILVYVLLSQYEIL